MKPSSTSSLIGKLTLSVASAALALGGMTSFAQNSDSSNATDTEDQTAVLKTVTVTARKRSENLQSVPDSVVAISGETIERANITQVRDVTSTIPNVSIEESLSPTSTFVAVRGIASTRNGEPSVAYVVDGVQIGSSSEVSQAFQDVEQIEVLKGPQGALYGRNAIGGAIVITTRQPTDEIEGRATVNVGGNGLYEFSGAVSGPISDQLKFRLAGSFKDFNGTIENEFLKEQLNNAQFSPAANISDDRGAYVDFETNKDVRAKLIWTPSTRDTFELRLAHSDLEAGSYWYRPRVRLEDSVVEFPIGNDVNSVAFRTISNATLKYDHEFDFGTFTSITAYTETAERYGVPYEGRGSNQMGDVDFYNTTFVNRVLNDPTVSAADRALLGSALQGVGAHNFYDIENISQEIRFTSPSSSSFRWIGGLYLLLTERGDTVRADFTIPGSPPLAARLPNGNPGPTNFVDTSGLLFDTSNTQDNTAWAAFFSSDWDITDKLTLTTALRYDEDDREITRLDGPTINTGGQGIGNIGADCTIGVGGCVAAGTVEKATFDAWQPKVSLAYQATDDLLLYGTYARGFRSGGFNATGATLAETYDKELLDSYEVGFKSTVMNNRLRLNSAVFFQEFENSQVFEFDGGIFVQSLYNIPESEIYGWEADFSFAATPSLTINGGIGIMESEITEFDSGIRDSLEAALNAVIGNSVALLPITQAAFDDNFEGRKMIKFPHQSYNLSVIHEADLEAFGGSTLITRLDFSAKGDRYWWLDNEDKQDFVNLLDGSISLELADGWETSIWCKNCFDEEYDSAVEPTEMTLFAGPAKDVLYRARGRTYGAKVNYRF